MAGTRAIIKYFTSQSVRASRTHRARVCCSIAGNGIGQAHAVSGSEVNMQQQYYIVAALGIARLASAQRFWGWGLEGAPTRQNLLRLFVILLRGPSSGQGTGQPAHGLNLETTLSIDPHGGPSARWRSPSAGDGGCHIMFHSVPCPLHQTQQQFWRGGQAGGQLHHNNMNHCLSQWHLGCCSTDAEHCALHDANAATWHAAGYCWR